MAPIQFSFSEDRKAQLSAEAEKLGIPSANLLSKSIVTMYLDGQLVPAEVSADAQNLTRTIILMTERLEEFARDAALRSAELEKRMNSVIRTVDETTNDTFDQVTKLISVVTRIDRNADQINRALQELANTPKDAALPSVQSLSESAGVRSARQEVWSGNDRRSGGNADYTGPERRSGEERRSQPRNGADFFDPSQCRVETNN